MFRLIILFRFVKFFATYLMKLSKSRHGYVYVSLVIDEMSRFVWLHPLMLKKMEEISSVLLEIIFFVHQISVENQEYTRNLQIASGEGSTPVDDTKSGTRTPD